MKSYIEDVNKMLGINKSKIIKCKPRTSKRKPYKNVLAKERSSSRQRLKNERLKVKALNKVIRIYTHQIASLDRHRITSKPFKS